MGVYLYMLECNSIDINYVTDNAWVLAFKTQCRDFDKLLY
jgi:hypothetical protein